MSIVRIPVQTSAFSESGGLAGRRGSANGATRPPGPLIRVVGAPSASRGIWMRAADRFSPAARLNIPARSSSGQEREVHGDPCALVGAGVDLDALGELRDERQAQPEPRAVGPRLHAGALVADLDVHAPAPDDLAAHADG